MSIVKEDCPVKDLMGNVNFPVPSLNSATQPGLSNPSPISLYTSFEESQEMDLKVLIHLRELLQTRILHY